ncbi:MAG: GNAT family N-acetyltransferase [Clostridia bacterium]|nr:GNAT family N-acetyltransferase [Clostridia bacterium]
MAQLRMVWKNKEPAPVQLKEGCTVIDRTTDRFTKEQLAEGWIHACEELNGGIWSKEQFYDTMWNDPRIPKDGIFFAVTPDGRIFSTATARVMPGHIGDLHMVGSASDIRGLGGGRAVCTAVVEYFKKHEITLAYLNTDDFRIPAIKIYLGLGYRPYLYEDDMPERWHKLMDILGIETLEAYDADLNDLVMFSHHFEDR